MALTPAITDPKRDEELKRRLKEPETFGIGGGRSEAIKAQRAEESPGKKGPAVPPPPSK